MSNKYQDIPFLIDGTLKIVKSVTKNTTCSDVIDKLPSFPTKLSVYESVNGVERKLSGKTKLLKIWRANASSNQLVFVVRKSEQTTTIKKKRGLFGSNKPKCEQPINVKTAHETSSPTNDKLKQMSDLAFYVRYQKSKIQAINKKSANLMDNTSGDIQRHILQRQTSNSSLNSMDTFLAKADLDKMDQFLSFCGEVTSAKLNNAVSHDQTTDTIDIEAEQKKTKSAPSINKDIIRHSLKAMKFGIKQKFTTHTKLAARTTSTGTISSTDTGYQSVKSDKQTADDKTERRLTGIPKLNAFIDSDLHGAQRHSTPVIGQALRRTDDVMENTLTMTILDEFDESDGKNVILQKFMDGQTGSYNNAQTRRTDRNNMRSFNSQKEKCQFYWNRYCDSDSESSCCESDISEDLDDAFCNSEFDNSDFLQLPSDDIFTSQKRSLRRDSAISNLVKFPTKPVTFNETETGFDYSINCTFPCMEQSVDFSYIFGDDSDCSLEGCSSDESLDSFMKTRSFLDDVTTTKVFDNEDGFSESDEGLGSMASGSVSDCRSMII